MSLEVKKSDEGGKIRLDFSGHIDEEAQFPPADSVTGEVIIDLFAVKAINSVGIRSWLQWFRSLSPDCSFRFMRCPKAVVMQMNMVEGFLPDKAQVESFYVPYYCESCDEEVDQLFTVGKEVTVSGGSVSINFDPSSLCSDGGEAELDANETKYFKFLIKMGEAAAA